MTNTELLVVDRAGRVLPPGVKGELLIGGVGVSPGYVNNAGLTDERFVDRSEGRFFRTGDLTLCTESGTIEHFGRIDRQIKLRGFRIEPGEIESALNRLPGIESSHVVLREIGGDPRLVAYVVESKAGAAAEALREILPRQLPAYMVPAALVELAELPLSASGKVDQRALPMPEHRQTQEAAVLSPMERSLAELWQSLLGCPVRSPDEDFFALGGHSLLLARLSSLIQQRFEIRVSIRALMGATHLAEQAILLDRENPAASTAIEYGFLPARGGLFYAWHPAASGHPRGGVLLVPPLLNDMIRTRLMYRELALNLQDLGYAVLRFDLSGHGNSAGCPDSLGLDDWLEDIRAAGAYARRRLPQARWSVLSARFGAALATEALADFEPSRWITLDPVYSGAEWLRGLARWREEQAPVLRTFFGKNEYQGFVLGDALLGELERFSTSPHTAERRMSSSTDDKSGQPENSDFDVGWQHDSLQHIVSSGLVQTLVEPFT